MAANGTMRALVFEGAGRELGVEEVPVPEPRRGEVLVRVAACGVCHSDLHVVKDELPFPTPCVLGHEVTGTVAALGPGLEDRPDIAEGATVAASFIMPCGNCRWCVRGRDEVCEKFFALNRAKGVLYDGETRLFRSDGTPLYMYSMGGFADYAVVPATDVFAMPGALPVEESAILGCAVFTAYGAVRHGADLRAGETVAVVAMGGVGSNIVQIARAFGASRVIAVDISDEKLAGAEALGATDTINGAREDAVARVLEMTDGVGVDVAFEALGRPQTLEQAVGMTGYAGRAVAVGLAPGAATAAIPITPLVRGSRRLIGSYGARTRADMPEILSLAERGFIKPAEMVTRRFGLEEAGEALGALDRGEIRGRAIVVM